MLLKTEHLCHIYENDSKTPVPAINDINISINENEFISIIGHTGSGKSTLIQHLNGLMKPSSGRILYKGKDIWNQEFSLKELRSRVGLVFQYPEYQLFEETVFKDVCFGPRNQGLSEDEIKERASLALDLVGIDESFYEMSPFELSGGQKRRVAIAGVLAMEPEILILDEPTAGLDPKGRDEILGQICKLQKEKKISVILVSHSMEDVAVYAERLIVIDHGSIIFDDIPRNVFKNIKELENMGLAVPQVTYLARYLNEQGINISTDVITVQEAKEEILKLFTDKKAERGRQ